MMVYVDSKPLALSLSSLVVGTAQGGVNHRGRPLCGMADVLIATRRSLPQGPNRDQAVAPTRAESRPGGRLIGRELAADRAEPLDRRFERVAGLGRDDGDQAAGEDDLTGA